MSTDNFELPEDLGDTLPVDPSDFIRIAPPAGLYDASIDFVRYVRLPETDKFNPGLNQARVSYRLENCDDPKFNGTRIQGYGRNISMVTNGGLDKNGNWRAWCKTMGVDPKNPPRASELQGIPVKIRVGTRPGPEDRVFSTVEEIWNRAGEIG